MAIGGGWISLPLAVGVDCGHPRPLGVDHGHPQWLDLSFFGWFTGETYGHRGWPDLSLWPLGWIAATPNGQIYLLFFLFSGKVAGGGQRWMAASVAGGGRWVIYLVA